MINDIEMFTPANLFQYKHKSISIKTIYAQASIVVLSMLIPIRLGTFKIFQISYNDLEVIKNGSFSLVNARKH